MRLGGMPERLTRERHANEQVDIDMSE